MSLLVACVRMRVRVREWKRKRERDRERAEGCRIVNQVEDVQSGGVNKNCAVAKKCKHNREALKQNNKSKGECSPKVAAIGNRNGSNKKWMTALKLRR